jgi:hypothetical protein
LDTCHEALTWLANNRPDVAVIDVRPKDGDAESRTFGFAQFVSKLAQLEAFSDAIHALAMATPTEPI